MSAVVEHFQSQMAELRNCHCSMSYFYFNDQSAKQTHKDFLRALVDQLITQEAALSDEFLEEFSSLDASQLSIDRLQKYALAAIESYNTCYLITDGLDECAKNEAEKSVRWLLSLTKGGINASVRVLVSGQRDGVLDVVLASEPSISLETPSHSVDIHHFCKEMAGRVQAKFKITDALRDLIISHVSGEAQGTSPGFDFQVLGLTIPRRHVSVRKGRHVQSPESANAPRPEARGHERGVPSRYQQGVSASYICPRVRRSMVNANSIPQIRTSPQSYPVPVRGG